MSTVGFVIGLWTGATLGLVIMALLAAHGQREQRLEAVADAR